MITRGQVSDMSSTAPLVGELARTCVDALPPGEEIVEKVVSLGSDIALLGACAGGLGILIGAVARVGLPTIIRIGVSSGVSGAAWLPITSILDESALRLQAAFSSGDETVIYVLPRADQNAATHVPFAHGGIRKFFEGKKLVVQRISSHAELTEIVKREKNISAVWISAHGTPDEIVFGESEGRFNSLMQAYDWPKSNFTSRANVILQSCSTVAGKYSYAEELQSILGDGFSVTATTDSIRSRDVYVKDGEVSFIKDSSKDVTARFPRTVPVEALQSVTESGFWPTMSLPKRSKKSSVREIPEHPVIRIVSPKEKSGILNPMSSDLNKSSLRVMRKGDSIEADLLNVLDVRNLKDFSICIERRNGRCESIPLPSQIRQNIIAFLQDMKVSNKEFDCGDFVKGVHRQPFNRKGVDFFDWQSSPLKKSKPTCGDVVRIKRSDGRNHFALYLAKDLYLSKFGDRGGLGIASLPELTHFYQSNQVDLLKPKSRSTPYKSDKAKEAMREAAEFAAGMSAWLEVPLIIGEPVVRTALAVVTPFAQNIWAALPLQHREELTELANRAKEYATNVFTGLEESGKKMSSILQDDYGMSAKESREFIEDSTESLILGGMYGSLGALHRMMRPVISFPGFEGDHVVRVINGQRTLVVNLDVIGQRTNSFYDTFRHISDLTRASAPDRVWCKVFEMDSRIEQLMRARYGFTTVEEVIGAPALSTYALRIDDLFRRTHRVQKSLLENAVLFHATSEDGVQGILRTGAIDRSKRNDGFYVATAPDLQFGDYVLLLNKNAAKGNRVRVQNDLKFADSQEIGFWNPIPITENTLEGIAVRNAVDRELFASQCASIVDRSIPIIPMDRLMREFLVPNILNVLPERTRSIFAAMRKEREAEVFERAEKRGLHTVFEGKPKEFDGILSHDLTLVSFDHPDHNFWTLPSEVSPFNELEEMFAGANYVTMARIPAGERVRFFHGRERYEGLVQYYFDEFDPAWIKVTRPLSQETTPSFPAVKELWVRSLSEFNGLNAEGNLRFIDIQGKKILLMQLGDLHKGSRNAVTFLGSDLGHMGRELGADRVLLQSYFIQDEEVGYFGGDLLQVLKGRYGVRETAIDLPLSRYALDVDVDAPGGLGKFYEVPIYRSSLKAFPFSSIVEMDKSRVLEVLKTGALTESRGALSHYLQLVETESDILHNEDNIVSKISFREGNERISLINKEGKRREIIELDLEGLHRFKQLGLDHARVPDVLSVNINGTRAEIVMNELPGCTIQAILEAGDKVLIHEAFRAMGRGFADLHIKGRLAEKVAKQVLLDKGRYLRDTFSLLSTEATKAGILLPNTYEEIDALATAFEKSESFASMIHPDVHSKNFLYDQVTGQFSILDPGRISKSSQIVGHPLIDLYRVASCLTWDVTSIEDRLLLQYSMQKGYASIAEGVIQDDVAATFLHVRHYYKVLDLHINRGGDFQSAKLLLDALKKTPEKGALFPAIAPPTHPQRLITQSDWRRTLSHEESYLKDVVTQLRELSPDAGYRTPEWDAALRKICDLAPPENRSRLSAYLARNEAESAKINTFDGPARDVTLINIRDERGITNLIKKTKPLEEIASEVLHFDFLDQSGLQNGRVPKLYALEKEASGSWSAYMEYEPALPLGTLAQQKDFKLLNKSYEKIGRAYAEVTSKLQLPTSYKELVPYISDLMMSYRRAEIGAEEFGFTLAHNRIEMEGLREGVLANPGVTALAHDDPHAYNFLVRSLSEPVIIIDMGGNPNKLPFRITKFNREPVGHTVDEMMRKLEWTHRYLNFPQPQATELQQSYLKGFRNVHQREDFNAALQFFRARRQYDEVSHSLNKVYSNFQDVGINEAKSLISRMKKEKGLFSFAAVVLPGSSDETTDGVLEMRVQHSSVAGIPGQPRGVRRVCVYKEKQLLECTKDPLKHIVKHIDSVRDFHMCAEDVTGRECEDISPPQPMRANILTFIRNHRDTKSWNCHNFTAAAHGEYGNRHCITEEGGRPSESDAATHKRCVHPLLGDNSDKWEMESVGTTNTLAGEEWFYHGEEVESKLKSGDWVVLHNRNNHSALYLGQGLYFAKQGHDLGLDVCELDNMTSRKHPTEMFKVILSGTSKQQRPSRPLIEGDGLSDFCSTINEVLHTLPSVEQIGEKFHHFGPVSLNFYNRIRFTVQSVFDEFQANLHAFHSSGKETVIYVCPRYDSTFTYHVPNGYESLKELAQGRRLVFERIDGPEELTALLKKHENISHVWIEEHGSSKSIQFSRFGKPMDASFVCDWPLDHFAPGAQVILDSCSMGAPVTTGLNFAEELHFRLGGSVSVTAASEYTTRCSTGHNSAHIVDGRVAFRNIYENDRDITVRLPVSPHAYQAAKDRVDEIPNFMFAEERSERPVVRKQSRVMHIFKKATLPDKNPVPSMAEGLQWGRMLGGGLDGGVPRILSTNQSLPKSGVPLLVDTQHEDIPEKPQPTLSLAARYFQHAKVDMGAQVRPKPAISHVAGDRLTEMLNRHADEEVAVKALEKEVAGLMAYFEAKDGGALAMQNRGRWQGACLDGATAARNFGCPRLGAIFEAGYHMMKFEDAATKMQSIKDLKSPEGISSISSVTSAGLAMVSVFAALDNTPSNVFGPLQEQMQMYNTHLCHKIQGICEVMAHQHAEKMWEFERVRHELFSMCEDLKAQNGYLFQDNRYLRQEMAIGFALLERQIDFFEQEADFKLQELRLEPLLKIQDGINHYEFGKVSIDTIKGWAITLERWMSNPPARKMATGEFYADSDRRDDYIKSSSPAGKIGLMARLANIEEAQIDALVNLDTLESLLPIYATVLKILRQEGQPYDSLGTLWKEKVLKPITICRRVAIALHKTEGSAWKDCHADYMKQIARIRKTAAAKELEIANLPCMMTSVEKLTEATNKLAASEDLLADQLRALLAALADRK